MGGKSGGGSNSKTYDYYATFALVFRAGRVETLHSLLIDGKTVWDGPINRTDGGVSNPYTLTIADAKWVRPGGYVKFYWGEDTQLTADSALSGHPPYRGFAYMVFHKFLCGRERTTIPNVELIAEAKAEPGSVITGSANDSGCCNPWAIAAEFLTSRHGPNLPAARLDATTWQAAHDYCAATAERKLLTYCAPMLNEGISGREFLAKLLGIADGSVRLKLDSGNLEATYFPTDPGTLTNYATLTENDYTKPPKIEAETWDAVPTGVVVAFTDRDRQFKRADQFVHQMIPAFVGAETRNEMVDLSDYLTRGDQAGKLAASIGKRICYPRLTGTVEVRPEKAVHPTGHPLVGEPIRPGDRFQLDVDIEPGGSGLSQLARCLGRTFSPTGGVSLRWQSEANQPALPFTPVYTPPGIVDIVPTNIAQARIIALPPSLNEGQPAIGVLAQRPDDMVVGLKVLFDTADGSGDYAELGNQIGFATYGLIDGAYSDTATGALRVDLDSTRDLHLVTRDVGSSGALADELLLIVYTIDPGASNYIDDDANGLPELEIFSIDSSAVVSGQKYDFTVLRSRLGTTARSFADNASCFIIPRSSLVPFTHADLMSRLEDAVAFKIRLQTYNRFAEYEGTLSDYHARFPAAYRTLPIIAWTAPSGSQASTDSSGNYSPTATVTDYDGNLVKLELFHKRTDTSAIVRVLNTVFQATNSKSLATAMTDAGVSTTVNFTGQASADTIYLLTIRATDSTGQVEESTRTILRVPTSGSSSTPPPPSFGTPSKVSAGAYNVTITATGSATHIHYYSDPLFSSTAPGSYTDYTGTSKTVLITGRKRLWARASTGSVHSAWVFEDYDFSSD